MLALDVCKPPVSQAYGHVRFGGWIFSQNWLRAMNQHQPILDIYYHKPLNIYQMKQIFYYVVVFSLQRDLQKE